MGRSLHEFSLISYPLLLRVIVGRLIYQHSRHFAANILI